MPLPPKEAKKFRALLKKLKVPKKVQDILFDIKVELHDSYEGSFQNLRFQIQMWERLYLDRPEDRLWHAKDRTWWKRLHGKEKIQHERLERDYLRATFGSVRDTCMPEYDLYRASPPPEIHALAMNAHLLVDVFLKKAGKKQPKELVRAIGALSRVLKPFTTPEYMEGYKAEYSKK